MRVCDETTQHPSLTPHTHGVDHYHVGQVRYAPVVTNTARPLSEKSMRWFAGSIVGGGGRRVCVAAGKGGGGWGRGGWYWM